MNLVLYVKVDQGEDAPIECARDVFPILDGGRVGRAQDDTSKSPRDGGQQIRDHEDVMPVVVIGGGDVGPAGASHGPEQSPEGDEAGHPCVLVSRQQVPEADEREPGAGGDGDEDLKSGSLGVSVADGGGDGWKPFLRVAIPFVLDNLVVVEGDADEEGAEECGWS